MVLAPLLAAPAVMLAATAAERRFGATVAGAVGAAPVALAVVILSVGDSAVAFSAAAHVVAQVAFAVAFALIVALRGGRAGLAAGVTAFVAVSALVEFVPPAVAIAAAIPALLAASRWLPEHTPATARTAAPPSRVVTGTGAAASVALVASALTAAEWAGPAAAGVIGAFPAVSSAFALVLVRARGRLVAANALRGLAGGLRGYLAFCLVVAAAAPAVAVGPAVALGVAACAAQNFLPSSMRLQPPARARSKHA